MSAGRLSRRTAQLFRLCAAPGRVPAARCAPNISAAGSSPLSAVTANRTYCSAPGGAGLQSVLRDEITAEKEQAEKAGGEELFKGFRVETNRAEVTLRKDYGGEKIKVSFNVNHAIQPEASEEDPMAFENAEMGGVSAAKPAFTVEVRRDGAALAFECEIAQVQDDELPYDILEIYMFTGDKVDEHEYATSGGIVDGTIYEHLVSYMEERGVDAAFVAELVRYATRYEHGQYIGLLERMHKFLV